jgi:hypothetical protein
LIELLNFLSKFAKQAQTLNGAFCIHFFLSILSSKAPKQLLDVQAENYFPADTSPPSTGNFLSDNFRI